MTTISYLLSEEKRHQSNYKFAIGIDEAGRGPLAGPVVCCACLILSHDNTKTTEKKELEKIKILLEKLDCVADSKLLTEEKREELYEILINSGKYVKYGISIIDNNEIDRINILAATMLGMTNAVNDLFNKNKDIKKENCIALIDGNKIPDNMPIESKYIIKGDGSVFSIAAASILAKVTRDRIMLDLHKKYPIYGLSQHKGYPTFTHRSLLMQYGPSDIHRYSYGPVRDAAIKFNIKFSVPYKEEKEKLEKEKAAAKLKENSPSKSKSNNTNNKKKNIKKSKKVEKVIGTSIKKKIMKKLENTIVTRRSSRLITNK